MSETHPLPKDPSSATPASPSATHLPARVVRTGEAEGEALVSSEPIGFLGGVDPETGIVIEAGHPLESRCIAGRVLVFPTGKGSTVGSYTLYRLARAGLAPAAIVNVEADPVVAVGAIIAEIPMVDQVDIACIRTGDWVQVRDRQVIVWRGEEPRGNGVCCRPSWQSDLAAPR